MKRLLWMVLLCTQGAYAFWPFDFFFKTQRDPLPPYVLEHPAMDGEKIYGVGNGKSFLEAKSRALNDIATQLRSDVRSITSVHKTSDTGTSSDLQVTVLTRRLIENYKILDETHANGEVYLLIEYKR